MAHRPLSGAMKFLINERKKIEDKYDVKILFGNTPMSSYESNMQVSKDFIITTVISLVAITFVILLSFQNLLATGILFAAMLIVMIKRKTSLRNISNCRLS